MSEWKFRLALPADAEAFSDWIRQNPQIDPKDVDAGLKKNNPTVVTFVVEKDGVPIAFAPLYAQMVLAHLGLNPDADGKDKLRALAMMTDGVSGFAVQFGVREITTLSNEKYPIAQWAVTHGFELDTRQVLKLDLNRVLETVGV